MSVAAVASRTGAHRLAAVASSAGVLAIAMGFFAYAFTLSGKPSRSSYDLQATFLSSNGLHPGADVVLAGVSVGMVTSVALDERSMLSHVVFSVQQDLHLPDDTRLSIGSSTITSGNALIIIPGASHRRLSTGTVITRTCEASSLEQQISQYIFGAAGSTDGCDG